MDLRTQIEHKIDLDPFDRLAEACKKAPKAALVNLLKVYFEHSPKIIEELENAISLKDHKQIVFFAHRLKSASAVVGATHVTSLAQKIQCIGEDSDLNQIEELFQNLVLELKEANTLLGILEENIEVLFCNFDG